MCICLIAGTIFAHDSVQKNKNHLSIALNTKFGGVLPSNDFVKGNNLFGSPLSSFQAYSLKLLWQNPAYYNWQKQYKIPYYGLGISFNNFFNPQEIGQPVSIYGNLGLPVKRWNKLELYADLQFGLAVNWIHFNPNTNPNNIAIGSPITAHIDVGLLALYPLSKHFDFGAGFGFLHFSNGSMQLPNYGLNIVGPSLELKYHLKGRPDTKNILPGSKMKRSDALFFMVGFGRYQFSETFLDNHWTAVGFSTIYYRQLSNGFRLGTGVDVDYLSGIRAVPENKRGIQGLENFTVGIGLYPEMIIDRLSIVGGVGMYAFHIKFGDFKKPYQRLGVRYDFRNNMSAGINIRSVNFSQAEFLEFNIGYRIRWMKE